ncbi:hypothetical protein [Chroococcidiopsis sp. CCMEE 29]|uniref:hypothetical protein n=1 Tax=Chroococcidiopsis sp. CCMEE 29 TaxID=155894 RepID=UPI0020227280|nr:hypothetical protein [Chroococcidiopsis sp. CCMEE 29]
MLLQFPNGNAFATGAMRYDIMSAEMTVISLPHPLPLSQAWERGAGGGVRATKVWAINRI